MMHNGAPAVGQPYQPTAGSGLGGRDAGRLISPGFMRPTPLQSQTIHLPQPVTPSMPTPSMVRSGPDTASSAGRREGYPPNSIILRGPQSPAPAPYQWHPLPNMNLAREASPQPQTHQPYQPLNQPAFAPGSGWQGTPMGRAEPNRAVQAASEYRPPPAREYSEPVRSAPAEQVRSQPAVVEHYSAPAPAPAAPAAQSSYGAPGYSRSGR